MSLNAHRSVRALVALGLAPLLVLSTLLASAPAQAQKIRPTFFGMHDGLISSGSIPGVELGAVRLWDSGTSWRQIETANGVFDFTATDQAVENAEAAGLRPMLVLGQTPRFHATKRNAAGAYGRGATSMPRIAAWTRYVGRVAQRYGNRVDYQIWNEPNVKNYWTGTTAQMAKLTATASTRIKRAAGRRATVVAPAFPLRLKGQQGWYTKYWASKVGRKSVAAFVNVVAVNLYPEAKQAPEAQLQLLNIAKRQLPKAARKKPMWNTEINYGLLGGDTARRISAAKQASFVARTLLLNAASPIRRVYWYRWAVGPIANTHLVEDDRTTLTRAGRAWDTVHGWINRTDVKSCSQARRGKLKGVYTCTVRVSRTEVRRVHWKPSGRAATITTPRSTRSWTNLAGTTTDRNGRYRLRVGSLPVMVSSRS
ncbi:GH39 family glycosyl hydrolase [Nocardioides euryhalodurans]|nr:hypothetical protein [Nocardioides euryhalodurans]